MPVVLIIAMLFVVTFTSTAHAKLRHVSACYAYTDAASIAQYSRDDAMRVSLGERMVQERKCVWVLFSKKEYEKSIPSRDNVRMVRAYPIPTIFPKNLMDIWECDFIVPDPGQFTTMYFVGDLYFKPDPC